MHDLFQDIRYSLRTLRKSPGFTAVAVLSLALGIGAATAVFSVVNAVLLRSLPVPNPQELRVVQWTAIDARPRSLNGYFNVTGNRAVAECVSPALFASLREAGKERADVFGFAPVEDAVVRSGSESFSAGGMVVSDNFFSALRVSPVLGRLFGPGDAGAGAAMQVVISFDLWGRRFGHDPQVVGRSLTLNGSVVTIVGVLPEGFTGVRPGSPHEFFVPMVPDSPFLERAVSVADHWWVRMMARLRPGTTDAGLKAALETAFVPQALPQMKQPEILVRPGGGGLAFDRDAYGKPLLMLLAVVGLVLLVACANISGLLLARGAARRHELAVRAALGAGRWRLLRQALAESVTLALVGGAAGVLVALWGRSAISRLLAQSDEGLRYDLSLDLTVLGFGLLVALLTAFLSGLLPALRSRTVDPNAALKSRTALGTPRLGAGRALVVAQIALSLVLLSGAGLYLRTLANLKRIDVGFETDRLLVFQLNANSVGYPDAQLASFYERVQSSLAGIPGVRGASLTVFPLLDNKGSSGTFTFVGRALASGENPQTSRLVVGETFFDTMGIRLLRGRGPTAGDGGDAPKAIVVNETFARRYFPGEDPIGHSINTWRAKWQIVGVCGDARYQNVRDPVPPTVYIPFRQFPLRFGAYFVVRTQLPPMALAGAVRGAVAAIDPGVPVAHLTTQDQLIDRTIGTERLFATLCGGLAGFALLLCCVGLYGLLSFNVARRTREIGLRMAIGARPRDVARGILGEASILATIGAGCGLPVVLAVNQLIRSQLYGVKPTDPLTLTIVTATLGIVTVVAAWLPARGAARLDPMLALRHD
jgi:predicted permease